MVSFGDLTTQTTVYSSIIAGNAAFDVQKSRNTTYNSFVSLGYNLVGFGTGFLSFNNNDQVEVLDPELGPLANNGGRTLTHKPLAGSPVVDAGDPAAVPGEEGVPEFDQRGEPFSRLGDGDADGTEVLDIGAFELPTPEPDADFDQDGDTDGFDFLSWQRRIRYRYGSHPG